MAATVWTGETLAEDAVFVRQLSIKELKSLINPLTQSDTTANEAVATQS